MNNKSFLLLTSILFTASLYSCKKESQTINEEKNQIIRIDNASSSDRVDLTNLDAVLNFETANTTSKSGMNTLAETPSYPYQLVYKGKIDPILGENNNTLSALEISAIGNYYAIAYQTPGPDYGGGVDIFQIQSGVPQLISNIKTPNADVTRINNGGGRLYLGMDLKTFESFDDFPAPAVVGVVKANLGNLSNPQVVGTGAGYSLKDLAYDEVNDKLYAASSTQGGVSIFSFSGNKPTRTGFSYFGGARSITLANNDLVVSNAYSYSFFDKNTANSLIDHKLWPVPSNEVGIGAVSSLSNGNFLFGNNYALVYVDKDSNNLLDQIDVGGWINSISIVNDKIYISAGNSLVVAEIENNKIKVIAKAHFKSLFGGDFNVITTRVAGNYVFVACGKRGTYVFNLKKI